MGEPVVKVEGCLAALHRQAGQALVNIKVVLLDILAEGAVVAVAQVEGDGFGVDGLEIHAGRDERRSVALPRVEIGFVDRDIAVVFGAKRKASGKRRSADRRQRQGCANKESGKREKRPPVSDSWHVGSRTRTGLTAIRLKAFAGLFARMVGC